VLLKPGAEKLCEIYGLAQVCEVTQRIEDWEKPFFHYEIRCDLVSKRSGQVVGSGLGSCNSLERRYKNQDIPSQVNAILKIAKKRAVVDATLSVTRSSALFTQDEDIVREARGPRPAAHRPAASKPELVPETARIISEKQREFILRRARAASISERVVEDHVATTFGCTLTTLPVEHANMVLAWLAELTAPEPGTNG